jgi:hypothetical protein
MLPAGRADRSLPSQILKSSQVHGGAVPCACFYAERLRGTCDHYGEPDVIGEM